MKSPFPPLALCLLAACGGAQTTDSSDGLLRRGRASMSCMDGSSLVVEADGRVFTDGTQVAVVDADGTATTPEGEAIASLAEDGTITVAGLDGGAELSTTRDALRIEGRPSILIDEAGNLLGLGPEGACTLDAAPEHRRYLLYGILLALAAPDGPREGPPEPDAVEAVAAEPAP